MLLELRKYISKRQKRSPWPWLFMFDVLGLILSIGLVILQVGRIADHDGRVFVLLLCAFALNSYLLLDQIRTLEAGLGKNRIIPLFTPLLAGVLVLVFQALSRSYYSGRALAIFVIFWSLWLVLGRFIHRRYRPPVKILLVEPCSFASELKKVSGVKLTLLQHPPKILVAWMPI